MESYIEKIKNAQTKEELQQISYDFTKNTQYKITSKEVDLIISLCVYRECLINNASKNELEQCAKTLKLPKNIIKNF